MLHGKIEKTIYDWIRDDAIRSEPRSAGTFRVDPDVETFSAIAGIVRETVRSVRFIVISPFAERSILPGDQGGRSKTARISESSAPHRAVRAKLESVVAVVTSAPDEAARSSTLTCLQNPVRGIEKGRQRRKCGPSPARGAQESRGKLDQKWPRLRDRCWSVVEEFVRTGKVAGESIDGAGAGGRKEDGRDQEGHQQRERDSGRAYHGENWRAGPVPQL
jgi:hypothetical protein